MSDEPTFTYQRAEIDHEPTPAGVQPLWLCVGEHKVGATITVIPCAALYDGDGGMTVVSTGEATEATVVDG